MANAFSRREWLATMAAGAISAQTKPASRPNIVFILADDLGYADLGSYGNKEIQTPTIDSLARDGVRFTNFYVTWPACTPSRGSILTGRYPQRNGLYEMIRNNEVNWKFQFDEFNYSVSPEMTLGLDTREVTIGQAMKSAGYATGVVGKWDSGRAKRYLPLQRGFDFYYGFANTGIDYYTHERYGVPSMFRGNERIKEEGHATDLFTREAKRFIEQNKDRPFFLYVPFNAPHGASTFEKGTRQVPEKYLAMYGGGLDNRTQYKALVTHLDDSVAAILKQLDDLGLSDNTLVLFSSDNGGTGRSNNGGLRGGKSGMYEGGLRVPFIAYWKGRLPKDRVVDDFATSLELFTTLLSVAGAKPPAGVKLDGFDLMPILQGKGKSPRREMFWYKTFTDGAAARVDNWKYVSNRGKEELFDLSTDVGEERDLSREKPEILAKVKARYAAWQKEMEASEPRGPFRDY